MNTETVNKPILVAGTLEEAKAIVDAASGPLILKLYDRNLGREHMEEVFELTERAKGRKIDLLVDEILFLETTAERHLRNETASKMGRKWNPSAALTQTKTPYYRQFEKRRI